MKKKVIALWLAVSMTAASAVTTPAAEFTDGAFTSEALTDSGNEAAAEEEFTDLVLETPEEEVAMASATDLTGKKEDLRKIHIDADVVVSETKEFIQLVNEARRARGLNELKTDKEMMALAEMRAIQANVVYPHHLPDGRSVSEVFTCGECAMWYTGKNTAQRCFEAWKNSPPHWSILMGSKYTRIGFAISGNFAYTNVCWPSVGQGYEPYRGAYKDYSVKDYEIQVKKNFVQLDSPQSQTMKIGETLQLNVKGNPFSITENRFLNISKYELAPTDGKWESSNSTVAPVNNSGKVTARKAGTATVKFYLNGDRNIYSKFTIKVTGSTKPAEPTEPKPTPKPTQPKPTQPKPTQPKPTEPKPTEPKPTPKPTEPTEPQKPDTSKKINLTASVKGQDITLKWNTIPGFDSQKDRCEIQFRVNDGPLTYTSRNAELKQTTGRFDLASGKHKPGTKLKFKIRFYHPSSNSPWANNIYSGFSNEVTVVIGKDAESTPKPTEPNTSKKINLTASVKGRDITLKWNTISGFDSKKDKCEIQYHVNDGPLTYTTRDATLKQVTDTFDYSSGKHKPGTKVRFKVRFYHTISDSPWADRIYSGFSNEVTVVMGKDAESTPKPTEPKPVQPPAAPKIFSVSNSVRGRLTVKWHKVSGARNYRVYRKASSTGTFRLVGTTNHTFFTNQYDMKAGTTYYYQVRAVGKDANGKDVNGKFSNVVSAKCR